jgi:hypothetical protein
MFVYDTVRNMWIIEDGTHATSFAFYGGSLYMIGATTGAGSQPATSTLYELNYPGPTDEGFLPWSAEFVPFTETVMNKKLYSKLWLRAELSPGASLSVSIKHDDGDYTQVYTETVTEKKSKVVTIPIAPRRCDRFSLKLAGTGWCRIKAITREVKTGSEM